MRKPQPVRGTHDLLPADMRAHARIVETAYNESARYGYQPISTPIFEFTEVFARTLGETSDVVTKEMYTFTDKGGDSLTLRPEGTAGIARAFISGGMQQDLPLRFFSTGPMFRHERPQKGRLRQFHQIDVELIGIADPRADVEVIALASAVLGALGVLQEVTLELNSLGDSESRVAYRDVLVDYLRDHISELSDDSRERLERNPLRVLDSKDRQDRMAIEGAPRSSDHMTPAASDYFGAVCQGLDDLDIPYNLNDRLVRGLDYYCHTAFEFVTTKLGAQGTVLAGGRYDGLIEKMGGPATPAIGWAGGIERLSMMCAPSAPSVRPVAVIPIGAAAERQAMIIARDLRAAGITVDMAYTGNVTRRMKRAHKVNARAAVLFGDDELRRGGVSVKDLDSGEQFEIERSELGQRLPRLRRNDEPSPAG